MNMIDLKNPKIYCVFCDAAMGPEAEAYQCSENCPDFFACKTCYGQDLCSKVARHQHQMKPSTKKTSTKGPAKTFQDIDLD